MRVLCTTTGSPSHGRAQLPLLRALAAAGHDVRVVTSPAIAGLFRPDGLRVVPALPELDFGALLEEEAGEGPGGAAVPRHLDSREQRNTLMELAARALGGPLAKRMYAAVGPLAREFRPHLVLRDGMDLGACLLAEELGVPHLPTPSGAGNVIDPAGLHRDLNALRAGLGLPLAHDPLSIVAHGRIDYVPARFSFARHLPAPLAYAQTVTVERRAALPGWFAELPADRPLVWAALGTALPELHRREEEGHPSLFGFPDPVETLRAVVGAAAELTGWTVVVATAGLPLDGSALPPHVRTTDGLPQPLVLECADLFLTHGGYNSIREALRTATPLAVLPHFGDQYPNAERVEELGLGREITDRTPGGIAAACRAVLADGRAASTARRARQEMLTLPDVGAAVDDLVALAGGGA